MYGRMTGLKAVLAMVETAICIEKADLSLL